MASSYYKIRTEKLFLVPLAILWKARIDPEQVGSWFAFTSLIVPERNETCELFWRPGDIANLPDD